MTTVSETLYKAADLLEENGWVQGPGGWPWNQREGLCLEGALMGALGTRSSLALTTCPAYVAVRDYLAPEMEAIVAKFGEPVEGAAGRIYRWNDQSERTQAEVIEVLRAAAVIEAAKESAPQSEAAKVAVR